MLTRLFLIFLSVAADALIFLAGGIVGYVEGRGTGRLDDRPPVEQTLDTDEPENGFGQSWPK